MRMDRVKSVKLLLATEKVDLTYSNPYTGYNLLHDAAWSGHLGVGQLILETNAFKERMEEIDKKGRTALHMASFRATAAFCKMLCDYGSIPDAKEKTTKWISQDPATMAERMGKPEAAQMLRELTVALNAVKFASKMKVKAKKSKSEASMKADLAEAKKE